MQFLTDYRWFAKIDKIKIQGFTNGCDATDQCTASCTRIGKRAERGQKLVEGQQVNVKPRLVYHKECAMHPVQTAASDLKCDYAGRKWLVCNNHSALFIYECHHTLPLSTIYYIHSFLDGFDEVDNKPSTKLSIKG